MWWKDVLRSVDLSILIRAFYLLSALAILILRLVPPLRNRFLDYGARQLQRKSDDNSDTAKASKLTFLDSVAQIRVSHTRFCDFYVFSLLCLAFWVSQVYTDVVSIRLLRQSVYSTKHESPLKRIALCFLLLAIQSLRRLYECLTPSEGPSLSTMWIGHYLIGFAFYFFTNIAIFSEQTHTPTDSLLSPTESSVTILDQIALPLFVLASVEQHQYHKYLSSLKKYTLPNASAFKNIIAPHYTAECLIYLSLAVLSAPRGHYVNETMLCALVFVIVNLGVTAEGTKRWMLSKFSEQRADIENRWRMIPMVF